MYLSPKIYCLLIAFILLNLEVVFRLIIDCMYSFQNDDNSLYNPGKIIFKRDNKLVYNKRLSPDH